MKKQIKVSFFFTLISTIGLGIIYPVLLAGIGLLVPSLSLPSLLMQPIQREDQFQGRPSMSGGSWSGASNLSLTSLELQKQVAERLKQFTKDTPGVWIPRDLLFASASGYDADLSVEGAMSQIPRIAKARNIDKGILQPFVNQHIHPKLWGFIGTEMVNVIDLNQELETFMPKLKAAVTKRIFHIER